jgi:hypothetical protein
VFHLTFTPPSNPARGTKLSDDPKKSSPSEVWGTGDHGHIATPSVKFKLISALLDATKAEPAKSGKWFAV